MVSSTGPAARARASYMGVYLLTDQTFNNFPVYEKTGGGQFLYVDNDGYWTMYRYFYWLNFIVYYLYYFCFSEVHPTQAGIYHPENNPTPSSPPVTGWECQDGGWKVDDQLIVTARIGTFKTGQLIEFESWHCVAIIFSSNKNVRNAYLNVFPWKNVKCFFTTAGNQKCPNVMLSWWPVFMLSYVKCLLCFHM